MCESVTTVTEGLKVNYCTVVHVYTGEVINIMLCITIVSGLCHCGDL